MIVAFSSITFREEIKNANNEMVKEGFTPVPFPKSTVGLVPIEAGGKTLWFKPQPEKGTGGDTSSTPVGLLQTAIDGGNSPEEAALNTAGYYESLGFHRHDVGMRMSLKDEYV